MPGKLIKDVGIIVEPVRLDRFARFDDGRGETRTNPTVSQLEVIIEQHIVSVVSGVTRAGQIHLHEA